MKTKTEIQCDKVRNYDVIILYLETGYRCCGVDIVYGMRMHIKA